MKKPKQICITYEKINKNRNFYFEVIWYFSPVIMGTFDRYEIDWEEDVGHLKSENSP